MAYAFRVEQVPSSWNRRCANNGFVFVREVGKLGPARTLPREWRHVEAIRKLPLRARRSRRRMCGTGARLSWGLSHVAACRRRNCFRASGLSFS